MDTNQRMQLKLREERDNIRLEDVLAKIAEVGDELCFGLNWGVNYYTGQVLT
jgi:hypothetical protein